MGCIRKRAKPRPVLLDSSGREIRDIEVIKTMHQFRDVKEIEGIFKNDFIINLFRYVYVKRYNSIITSSICIIENLGCVLKI